MRGNYDGERIRKVRKEHNLTQEQLAKALNVSKSSIANYENGKTVPSMSTLIKLATIFNATMDELLGLEQPEEIVINLSANGIRSDEV